MRLPCTYTQTGVAFAEDQHAIGGLGPGGKQESLRADVRAETAGGIITVSTPARGRPSQASNQVNVLVTGFHGCCPSCPRFHLSGLASARTYDNGQDWARRPLSAENPQLRAHGREERAPDIAAAERKCPKSLQCGGPHDRPPASNPWRICLAHLSEHEA
jgi:hypothetical protein